MNLATILATIVVACSSLLISAQTAAQTGITAVAASGKISGNQYSNAYFHLVLSAPNATLRMNPVLNAGGQRARLVQVMSKNAKWEDNYNFAVLADALKNYAGLESAEHYVRSVRHQLEQEGMPTVKEEFPLTISSVQFAGAIVQEHAENGRKYYRGMFSTFRSGYILSFDVEAASPDKLRELVARLVRFGGK